MACTLHGPQTAAVVAVALEMVATVLEVVVAAAAASEAVVPSAPLKNPIMPTLFTDEGHVRMNKRMKKRHRTDWHVTWPPGEVLMLVVLLAANDGGNGNV